MAVSVKFANGDNYAAGIVIAIADRQSLAVLNSLWGSAEKLSRGQISGGPGGCYYSVRSNKSVRYGAYVSVLSGEDEESLEHCIWEETLHALGPLQDAKGSPFFSFDDTADEIADRRDNDILLIRALYESGPKPGDPPDEVIDHLAKIAPPDLLAIRPETPSYETPDR